MAYLITGVLLGLSAGFSPGPLLALILAETLRHNTASGIKVAIAPLITDFPIVLVSLLVLSRVTGFDTVLGILSLAGCAYVTHLGYESLKIQGIQIEAANETPRSLQKGILVNFLSPNPYIFWFTVGAPITLEAWQSGPLAPVAFIGPFYVCLVGSKVLLAILTGKSRAFLSGKIYVFIMRTLGVLLIGFALFLLRDGVGYLGG